ncbi:hypothetical protein [Halothiobacillus sp. 15-55-196]|uniref:hypothetical protein n=1 Tax=Halothiobacillus sp. 15-55-196 TaxID=1970382 RepID=UPI0025C236D9|nr:hypothetical protein [Halothiobacillus sp. 15-55-196]
MRTSQPWWQPLCTSQSRWESVRPGKPWWQPLCTSQSRWESVRPGKPWWQPLCTSQSGWQSLCTGQSRRQSLRTRWSIISIESERLICVLGRYMVEDTLCHELYPEQYGRLSGLDESAF